MRGRERERELVEGEVAGISHRDRFDRRLREDQRQPASLGEADRSQEEKSSSGRSRVYSSLTRRRGVTMSSRKRAKVDFPREGSAIQASIGGINRGLLKRLDFALSRKSLIHEGLLLVARPPRETVRGREGRQRG